MRYRALGRSGLEVSMLCLGTMTFGATTNGADAQSIMAHARDHGVNFMDTADAYQKGGAEEIIADELIAHRSHWILATKVCNPMSEDRNQRGLSKRWVVQGLEASLKRLKTDCVDILYLHKEDHRTPLEETVAALALLIRQGKIRYIGVSNFRAWRIAELVRLCDAAGIDRPVVCQPYYNALNRQPEVEVLPACAHYGLGVVPYSPLARGVLTAKYVPDAEPDAETRAGRKDGRMLETEWRRESLAIAQRLADYCRDRGTTPIAFALQWLWANSLVSTLIGGPRTLEQWETYLQALDAPFGAEDEALLNGLVPPGHPSTPGYNDPRYPIEGRKVLW
ncbi:MAG: aldo/keto reductase [Geminicoccaceae bacterium]|nr:MAG: aldo/keto reductase [Geminicoccaceae bacterium]